MNEPTPRGTAHLVDKDAPEMHKKIEHSLRQMGHDVDVNPVNDLSLENIRDILGKTAVHVVNSPVADENLSARTEAAKGFKVISFIKEKMRKLKAA